MRKTNRILKILSRLTIDGKRSHFLGYNHIALMLASIIFLAVAIGINAITLPYVLFQNDVSTSLIGLTAASDIFGGIAIIYFLHVIGKKVGIFNSIMLFSFLAAASSSFRIGVTIGPIIVSFMGAGNYQLFVLSALLILISAAILFPMRKAQPKMLKHSSLKLSAFIKRNTKLVGAHFLTEMQYGTIMFFGVIYGMKSDISAEKMGLLLSVFTGVGLFDFLLGFIVNEKNYQKLLSLLILPLKPLVYLVDFLAVY